MRKGVLRLVVIVNLGVVTLLGGAIATAQRGESRGGREFAAKPGAPSSAQFALSLIDSGIEAARSCDPASRAIVLLIAGGAVKNLDLHKALTYYTDGFEAAESIEGSNLRLALQPILVAQVAELDLGKATDLVERMDTPEITETPDVDARVATASGLITKLRARNTADDPDRAVGLLNYLGDTGQYPYAAAGQVVAFFHQKGQDWRAVDVFMRAMGYFRGDNRFKNTPGEFIDLLQTSERNVPDSVLVSALHLCTARVKEAVAGQAASAGPREVRGGITQALVAQLQMIAQRLDPPSAKELTELSMQFHKASMTPTSSASERGDLLQVTGSETNSDAHVEAEEELSEARQTWERVLALAVKDPAGALTRAETIQAPEYRSRALATAARNLQDPAKAASTLRQAEVTAEQIASLPGAFPEERAKKMAAQVEAMAEIAEGWERLGNVERASASLGKAFALALDLLQKQAALATVAPSGFGAAAHLFRRLAQVEASLDPSEATKRAQAISDPRLRAYFLVSMGTELLGRI